MASPRSNIALVSRFGGMNEKITEMYGSRIEYCPYGKRNWPTTNQRMKKNKKKTNPSVVADEPLLMKVDKKNAKPVMQISNKKKRTK